MTSPQRAAAGTPTQTRQRWPRVASTHTLEELLSPEPEHMRACTRPGLAGCALLAASILTAAGACGLGCQLLAQPGQPVVGSAWGHLPTGLYYCLLVACSLPAALALVTWNWLSLKLFRFAAC